MATTTRQSLEHGARTPTDLGYDRRRFFGGVLLFAFGVVALMGIIAAEALYPGYNAGTHMISDLGATVPPDSVILQPSATIFNVTMMLSGALVLGATYLLRPTLGDRALTAALGLLGVGVLGVGVFDGSEAPMHGIFSMLTFFAGGITAVVAYRVVSTPFRYVSVAIGAFVLALLVSIIAAGLLGAAHPLAFLGEGGLERYVAYPVLLWTLGFGGYLMGASANPAENAATPE